jgi:hypothetical protein
MFDLENALKSIKDQVENIIIQVILLKKPKESAVNAANK